MPNRFTKPCCQPEELSGRSLVDILLELQDLATPNEKSLDWASDLKCLTVPHRASRGCHEMTLESIPETGIEFKRNYVAVSYPCDHMSAYEIGDTGKHTVVRHSRNQSPSRTRDIVIERAVRYANFVGSPHLWLDQDCIDQEDDDEKQLAMDSMDLVYRMSEFPVGLMSTVLKSKRDINLLHELLCGELASERGFKAACDSRKIKEVVDLLQLFSWDRWWKRAWIYQEEYLSGLGMDILIRHSPELERAKREVFGGENHIKGEIFFSATEFRKVATIFLLALKKSPSSYWQHKSKELLEVFGKYNVLYDLTAFANGKAMSFRVIADIHKRRITLDHDRLSIAANACDYATRFNATQMAKTAYSANLCTLAMILLNGEIIANDKKYLALPTTMGLDKYLDHICFDKFVPPGRDKELTWLKSCRLPQPKLVSSGIQSEGYIWEVQATMYTGRWKPLSRRYDLVREREDGLDDRQRAHLFELIKKLRRWRDSAGLIHELEKYLREDMKFRDVQLEGRKLAVARYRDVVAKEVCEAIEERRPLHLAAIRGRRALKAIFVGPCQKETMIFTAWSYTEDEDQRIRTRHLSLIVRAEERSAGTHIKIQNGVNGLVFFTRAQREPVVVSWPEAWLRINPEVIELSDDEDT